METTLKDKISELLSNFDGTNIEGFAATLHAVWSGQETKSIHVIKQEQRDLQETLGISVPALKEIAKVLAKPAQKRVNDFLPLTNILWDEYGREGRVIAAILYGQMELADPELIFPLLLEKTKTCLTWEDADRIAMDAVEPIIRKDPENWFHKLAPWLSDENKWVRRAGATIYGRLAMKHPVYTQPVVDAVGAMIADPETDVKKAVSFGLRLAARGETQPVVEFLITAIPPKDPEAAWVICDVIRSMGKVILPDFKPTLPYFNNWLEQPDLSNKQITSIKSAIKTLESV